MVLDPVIEATVNLPGNSPQKVAALIRVANDRGGRDNVSVLRVQVAEEDDARRGRLSRMLGK